MLLLLFHFIKLYRKEGDCLAERKATQREIIAYLPGIMLAVAIIFIGIYIADYLGLFLISMHVLPAGSASPISGIFVAILIGIVIRNTVGLADSFKSGVQFSLKYLLRAGIILLGLRLSLAEALKLGAWGLPLIVSCIGVGLAVTLYFTKKMNQSKRLGTLIACGTGICGVTAIMATAPVVKAKDDEISYAVANITIFGLISMLFYPYIANFFFAEDPVKAGLFLGTAIHDTAQVTGAALIYDQMYNIEKVVDVATVTKLTRNLFIIAVIPFISYLFFKNQSDDNGEAEKSIPKWYKLIPLFVVGFLLFALLRTVGDMMMLKNNMAFGLFSASHWESFYTQVSSFGSTYLLGAAMASVGLSTDLKMFKGLGFKPFLIGLVAAFSVSVVSFVLISLFGGFISI